MKGTTGPLQYFEGDYSILQKVKGGGVPGRGYYSNGINHEEQGFGWQKNFTSSKLILPATTKGGYHEVRVDCFFKDNIGRLTKKRRLKLEDARPDNNMINT